MTPTTKFCCVCLKSFITSSKESKVHFGNHSNNSSNGYLRNHSNKRCNGYCKTREVDLLTIKNEVILMVFVLTSVLIVIKHLHEEVV